MIEKNIQDILNAGIGLFKTGEENLKTTLNAIQSAFEELKTKGATENSEVAQKFREVLENSIKGVQDVSTQAENNMKKLMDETQKSYTQIVDQLKQSIGEERIQDLNNQFDDLASFIKDKADEITTAANSFTDTVKNKANDAYSAAKDATGSKSASTGKSI